MERFEKMVVERESCDCGSHIRHNNGGHYHLRSYSFYVHENDPAPRLVLTKSTSDTEFDRCSVCGYYTRTEHTLAVMAGRKVELEAETGEEREYGSSADPVCFWVCDRCFSSGAASD